MILIHGYKQEYAVGEGFHYGFGPDCDAFGIGQDGNRISDGGGIRSSFVYAY